MTVKLTPEEFAEKHSRRLKGSLEDIRSGVERVDEAPGKKAAAKQGKWVAALSEKRTQEKWARRVAAVTLEEWKRKTLNKGVGRIAAGIDEAHDKVVEFASALFSHQNAGLPTIHNMPDLTLEDSISRATAWIRHMSKFKR